MQGIGGNFIDFGFQEDKDMKKLSKEEMMNINAGAKYEETCDMCGYLVGTTYWAWVPLAYQIAKIVVGNKMREHKVHCTANQAGI